jgi:hypothetical protein
MHIVMKQLSKIFQLIMFLVLPAVVYCQEPLQLSHDLTAYYGIYGVREVDDASLYKSTLSAGVFGARYILNLNQKYSIGIEGAYENTEPELRSSTINEDFYIKSFFLCGRLSYALIKQKRFDLYIAGAFGIKRIDKYLLEEKEVTVELIKEITLIGFQYKILNKTKLIAELTNGDIALLKFGLTYRL